MGGGDGKEGGRERNFRWRGGGGLRIRTGVKGRVVTRYCHVLSVIDDVEERKCVHVYDGNVVKSK